MKIAASILNCNFLNLGEEIEKVQLAGIDAIHLDVMDGHFVPNLSFGVPLLKAIKPILKVPVLSHLMVNEPEKMIEYFIPDSDGIIFHIEATSKPNQCLKLIQKADKVAGIALNPNTPIEQVEPYLEFISEILIMSVYPGFGGQKFIPETVTKIAKTKDMIKNKRNSILIAVDGGVNLNNAQELIKAGADVLIAGTAIFHSQNYAETIKQFKSLQK